MAAYHIVEKQPKEITHKDDNQTNSKHFTNSRNHHAVEQYIQAAAKSSYLKSSIQVTTVGV